MNTKITDVIIHVDEPLNSSQFEEIADAVRSDRGAISVGRNSERPNFLMVAYNANQTRSSSILEKITGLGLHASLVGI
jgi:hypothetical protein